jgi:hypothetical protein
MSCSCGGSERCGCCEGTDTVTPRAIFNRPGLPAIRWRVGEHADFFETMRSRVARVWIDVETRDIGAHGRARKVRLFPLRALRTRAQDDPTIALLDLWSVVGDILSFYTERIAAEGYLRTATELQSVSELARLVGYRRRPGVSASVYLAFMVDDGWTEPLVIPAGARVQSLPEPGDPPVFFETGAAMPARAAWNELHARTGRPMFLPFASATSTSALYLAGTATRLAPNGVLLLSYGDDPDDQVTRRVASIEEDFAAQRTTVRLLGGEAPMPAAPAPAPALEIDDLIRELERPPSIHPATPARLALTPGQTFGPGSTAVDALLLGFHPHAADGFSRARANATVAPQPALRSVSAFRVSASIYGHTAAPPPPLPPVPSIPTIVPLSMEPEEDWLFAYSAEEKEERRRIFDLDTTYDAILPGTWVLVERPGSAAEDGITLMTKVVSVSTVSRTDYNLPLKVTRLVLEAPWLPEDNDDRLRLTRMRSTTILAAPEVLAQADEPMPPAMCGEVLELDRQVDGLEAGRWVVVSGERAVSVPERDAAGLPIGTGDVFSTEGVTVSELTMIAAVGQDTLFVDADGEVVMPLQLTSDPDAGAIDATGGMTAAPERLPGDRTHTFLQLASPLSYCYRRDTVKIYANVAHATHGETREEPLGSGDPTETFQTFTLKSRPLTYVSAPTTSGVESSLKVYVNDVRWREAENLLDLGPADRGHLTFADHEESTSVIFGDGRNGARLPAGMENVRSVYRSGIGESGNVRPGQLSQLVTNTDGLRGVVNPQRASGGADPEGLQSTRARAPLAVAALDRLVATRDYADFALLFAGIGKASAERLPSRRGQLVQVTVAGENDIPIDPTSDLQRNLLEALRRFGDPHLPIQVVTRELLALVIGARVKLHPDYLWEAVRPQLEAALQERFGFAHRDLAQDAHAAEALAAMQAVAGVDYVDLDLFAAVSESTSATGLAGLASTLIGVQDRITAHPDRRSPETLAPLPAQLAMLMDGVASTLILTEIPHE